MVSATFQASSANPKTGDSFKDGKAVSFKQSDKTSCPASQIPIVPRVIGTYSSRLAAVLQPFPILPRHVPQSATTHETPTRHRPIRPDTLQHRHTISFADRYVPPSTSSTGTHDDELIDVVNDFHLRPVNPRNIQTPNTKCSSSTSGISHPNNSPTIASTPSPSPSPPLSDCSDSSDTKKKSRTNYSPSQVEILEKAFFQDAYPDQQTMDRLSKELNIAENKLKVWFQNKRARMRRRLHDQAQVHGMSPITPMYSPNMPSLIPPYVVSPNHMMSASPRLGPTLVPYSPPSASCNAPSTPTRPRGQQQQLMSPPFQNSLPVSPYVYPFMYHHY